MSKQELVQPAPELKCSSTQQPTFIAWLSTRPDLWCAGAEIQAELFTEWLADDATRR